jgi:hypothetical protein
VHKATGTFYYGERVGNYIGVHRSTDDCNNFPSVANAAPGSSSPNHLQDKPWITVDSSGGARDGYVYVCWTRFVNYFTSSEPVSGEIRFSRSTNGGVSFSNDQVISSASDYFPFGCHIDVGSAGQVYVAWADRGTNDTIVRRSLDGGLTWDQAVQANSGSVRHPGIDRLRTCESGSFRPTLNGDIRMLAQAWMAVDTSGGPFNGNIYLVWAHDPPGGVDNSDVYFTRSNNGGVTWAPEMPVGGGTPTDQFEPFVEVSGTGTVSIAWYDRRNDPNNLGVDVYTTFSTDGGATLGPPLTLTDVSFPVPPITGQPTSSGNFDFWRSACYMAEYIAVAADAANFYYDWGDNRNTIVSASYPDGRPDPEVRFESVPTADSDGDGLLDAVDADDDNDSNLPPVYDNCKGACPGGYWRDTIEPLIGTDSLDRCADTATANDEAEDKWPPDFDDNRDVNVVDFTLWKAYYSSPPKPFNARADLDGSGAVNVLDFGAWKPYFGATCLP